MFGLSVATLALAASLSVVEGRAMKGQTVKRQAPVLPSYESYINGTRNDASAVTLQIDTNNTAARNQTAPLLYGIMHEVCCITVLPHA